MSAATAAAAGAGVKAATTSKALAAYEAKSPVKAFEYALRPVGERDVQVAITHCGICHSDVHALDNDWGFSAFPMVPGHEIVGVVVAAGPKALHAVGTRVGVSPSVGSCERCADCRAGEQNYCPKVVPVYGLDRRTTPPTPMYGGFSSHLVVDSQWAFALPDALPSETAAPLLCAGITVWSPLQRWAKAGQRVGVVGIGGLGHLALQFARAMGCHVSALTTSADKTAAAKGFGAADVIVTRDAAAMARAKRSFDLLLVTINVSADWNAYTALLRTGGTLCLVGIPDAPLSVNALPLVLRRLNVCGSATGSRAEVQAILSFAAQHRIVAQTELFDFTARDANAAIAKVKANTIRYRAVLRAKL